VGEEEEEEIEVKRGREKGQNTSNESEKIGKRRERSWFLRVEDGL